MYNWPYDFLSFVEKIKIDAQIIYREDHEILVDRDEKEKSKQIDWAKAQSNIKTTKYMAAGAAPNQQVVVGSSLPWEVTGRSSVYRPATEYTSADMSHITDIVGRYSSYRPDSSSDDESGGGGDSNY